MIADHLVLDVWEFDAEGAPEAATVIALDRLRSPPGWRSSGAMGRRSRSTREPARRHGSYQNRFPP